MNKSLKLLLCMLLGLALMGCEGDDNDDEESIETKAPETQVNDAAPPPQFTSVSGSWLVSFNGIGAVTWNLIQDSYIITGINPDNYLGATIGDTILTSGTISTNFSAINLSWEGRQNVTVTIDECVGTVNENYTEMSGTSIRKLVPRGGPSYITTNSWSARRQ